MQTLQAAHIDEDGYFTQLIHGDIDAIAKGLRVAHVKDSDTAPEISVGEELRKSLASAAEFKGSADEKKLKILCDQQGSSALASLAGTAAPLSSSFAIARFHQESACLDMRRLAKLVHRLDVL